MGSSLDRFLVLCCDEVERRASLPAHNEVLAAGAAEFRRALTAAEPVPNEVRAVPVAAHMASIAPTTDTVAAICAAAQLAAPEIPWIESPRLDDGGISVGIAPLNDVRDFGDFICGLMLLAPAAAYPVHSHPPHEIYLPIAGQGQWRHGGSAEYRPLEEDALVYNPPNERHAAVAADEPLLALFILWDQ